MCDGLQICAILRGFSVYAMVNVIVDQRFLCVADGALHSLQLLRDFKAGTAIFDHLNHGTQMTLGFFQPGYHPGMACMCVRFCHIEAITPRGG